MLFAIKTNRNQFICQNKGIIIYISRHKSIEINFYFKCLGSWELSLISQIKHLFNITNTIVNLPSSIKIIWSEIIIRYIWLKDIISC